MLLRGLNSLKNYLFIKKEYEDNDNENGEGV
jgi:hypothetical protein